jgi:hypothetical protein
VQEKVIDLGTILVANDREQLSGQAVPAHSLFGLLVGGGQVGWVAVRLAQSSVRGRSVVHDVEGTPMVDVVAVRSIAGSRTVSIRAMPYRSTH